MAYYLTMPDVADAEEIVAFYTGSSVRTFNIVMRVGVTSAWLLRATADGTFIPLVVVAAGGRTIALDDVVMSSAVSGDSSLDPT